MLQCRFISNQCANVLCDVSTGNGFTRVGTGGIWEFSVLAAQFCCEPKTLLKIKGIDLKKRVRWFMPLYPQRMIGWAWWESEVQNSSCSMLLSYV